MFAYAPDRTEMICNALRYLVLIISQFAELNRGVRGEHQSGVKREEPKHGSEEQNAKEISKQNQEISSHVLHSTPGPSESGCHQNHPGK